MMKGLRARGDELRVALMFLTRIPMGRVARQVPLAATVWAWPLAGLAVGGVFGLIHWGAVAGGLAPGVALALAMGAAVLVTGGLHLDGLADCADGLGGGADRARRLAIMSDSRLGSYGAMALILVLLLAYLGWQEITAPLPMALALGAVSRMGLPLCARLFPPAKPTGLGQHLRAGLGATGVGVALTLGFGLAMTFLGPGPGLLLGGGCLALQLGLCALAWRSLGGVTGDVLGAAQVLGGLAALLLAPLLPAGGH